MCVRLQGMRLISRLHDVLLPLLTLTLSLPAMLEGLTLRFAFFFLFHCPRFHCFLISPRGCCSCWSNMV